MMEASTAQPAQPDAPAPSEPQGQPDNAPESTDASPDLSAEVAALRAKVEANEAPAAPPQQADPGSIYDNLAGLQPEQPDPEQPEFDPTEQGFDPSQYGAEDFTDPYAQQFDEASSRMDALENAYLNDQIEKRVGAIAKLAEQIPQLADPAFQQRVADKVGPVADQYGNPNLRTDPALIQWAAQDLIAAEEAASATPAEEAAAGGAVLETGAGPGNQEAERSYSDAKAQQIVDAATPKTAFTSGG